MTARTLSLFEGYGIEIESMVVDRESLNVRPLVDELLRAATGTEAFVEDHDDGPIGWSNELVTHVVEFKTNGPAPSYAGLAEQFRASTARANALLAEGWNAQLMPSGMHPWMDPRRETRLWPHDHGPVYRAYDRLFDCRRHGWANLQSVHLNLPFANEDEFARLMAASRLALALVPALAASSPVAEGRSTGLLDTRLEQYRTNAARVPAMAGDVVPEAIYDFEAYREQVLGAVDRDLAAIGADPVLRGAEWTNARGVIARFDRMALEIRLIDAQECAAADLAVAAAVTGVVRGLVEERWCSFETQRTWPGADLVDLLGRTTRRGPEVEFEDDAFPRAFGCSRSDAPTAGDLWRRLIERGLGGPAELEAPLAVILEHGTLAQRLLAALGARADSEGAVLERADLRRVWSELCECLATGRSFVP